MKQKMLNIGLILSSLAGYLEWGGGNAMFLLQGEAEVLRKLFTEPTAVAHPFVLLPLFGQALLLCTVFQKQPSKRLTLIGLWSVGLLLLFMFAIGLLGGNFKIVASTLPFVLLAAATLWGYRAQKMAG